jgi:hypothetical protein
MTKSGIWIAARFAACRHIRIYLQRHNATMPKTGLEINTLYIVPEAAHNLKVTGSNPVPATKSAVKTRGQRKR